MFGLTFDKLIVIGVIGAFILGPTRLPELASRLATLVKSSRHIVDDLQNRARDELGPGYDDIDWQKLDPRQYDPRRIVREALSDHSDGPADVAPIAEPISQRSMPSTPPPTDQKHNENGA